MRNKKLNGLDLFSGIGGISFGLEQWVRTIAYCEQDRYAQAVLLSRMQSGDLDRAPIWDDVRTLRGDMLPPIDIIFGGFPCQDISVAGKGAGLTGERSGLFFEIVRLVDECKPSFVFLENVPAIRTRGLQAVAESFASRGYDFKWTILSAAEVGAPHLRKRWFALASHPDRSAVRHWAERRPRGREGTFCSEGKAEFVDYGGEESLANPCCERQLCKAKTRVEIGDRTGDESFAMADASSSGLQEQHTASKPKRAGHNTRSADPLGGAAWWSVEPSVGRVAYGVSNRVDRIKCLGNSVVPLQAKTAFKKLLTEIGDGSGLQLR